MQGWRDFYRHWWRCFWRGYGGAAIAAASAAAAAAAVMLPAWWFAPAGALAALLVWRAAAVTYALHARTVAEAIRTMRAHAQRCAQEMEQHRLDTAAQTAALRLDLQVLREQVGDLQKAERRAMKLAKRQLDAALHDCRHACDNAGLTPNAVLVELHKARQKVKSVLKPERAGMFAELTSQYTRLLKRDESGDVSEDDLSREQVATLRRASVAPSIEWLRDTIQQLKPEDLDPVFRP